ncbi:MAG TPA: outer membrane beta-barrel protein [Rhodanobacter sp.]
MSPSIRLARAISLALPFVAGPALADRFDWSLYGGVEHSDNINLAATAPTSQWMLIPGFGFDYNKQGATLQAQVSGGAEYVDYLGGPYANQKFGELAGTVNWAVLPQRLDFVAQDYASVQPVSTLSSDSPDNQQQTNVLMLGPTLHFDLGSAIHGEVDLRYINSRASRTTEFDSSRGEGALRLTRDVSPTSQFSFNVETQKVDFDDSDEIDYSRNEAFVRYVSKLARLDLDVAAGWSHISMESGGGSASNPLWRASVNWHATGSNMFGVSYTHNYSDAAQDLINLAGPTENGLRTTAIVPLDIQTGGAVIGSGIYLEKRLQANYGYSSDRLTISLSPWYRKLHYMEANIQPDETGRGGDAGVDYRLNPRLTLTGFANYEREDYTTLDRRDTTTNLGLALRQLINNHWSWRVSLLDQHRTSTAPGEGYRAKVAYLGVVYQR